MEDPIAICGFSIKFPQDATSPDAFWKMLIEKRCAMTPFPADRMNLDGFYQTRNRVNTVPLKGGHFVKDDLAVFDAGFFSISPTEAASLDPMQRWLLETAYRALENAGIPMEAVAGSSTAVYAGSFSMDYMLQLNRDPENPPTYAALGIGMSMLANRLSWFFDLRGPSIGLDSACSSTAMAIDIACQALRSGSCNMAMAAGCNLAFSPESYVWMSNINFLSPDSRSHSFDYRANGYARGEGVGVMILKRLSDAIRDGNTIRAVIRSTGSNEDGRTPGITQPSGAAQERLIRETYEKAGLSMAHTRFFEAHGTGTPIGDPREARAIGSAFRKYRSVRDPLYVGAVKSNIGHLEAASGLAGVIKAVLVLERGVIPPNANFERLNPKIDAEFLRLKFPHAPEPWPTPGLRRASVNSFGYGGANSHIVLDDAYNYLRLRSLPGKHCTVPSPPWTSSIPTSISSDDPPLTGPDHDSQRLFVWSAADKGGIGRIADAYRVWDGPIKDDGTFLSNLAYTLDSHRSHLPWRSFALLKSPADLRELQSLLSLPVQASPKAPRLGFVFTGQGAQWFAMGRELSSYPSYSADLDRADKYLGSIGCPWSVTDELQRPKESSKIDDPEFSQALCTILQVALVNLLRRFGIRPSAVAGHSSGEIAAAYAGGYISCESAWKLAYLRGLCSAELARASKAGLAGAMMSIGLSQSEAEKLIASINGDGHTFGISVACVNSPGNVTISGEDALIDRLKERLDDEKVFARKLRVPLAYHSQQMKTISPKYMSMIGSISAPPDSTDRVPIISSVTGERVVASRLSDPAYWAQNMESPVLFSQAITAMCAKSEADLVKKIDRSHLNMSVVDHLVELGPRAALQGPIRDILKSFPRGKSIGYTSVLKRGQSAMETMLRAIGELYSIGYALDLRAANEPQGPPTGPKVARSMLVNLPEYPFDHSQRYWHESRLSRDYRFRSRAPSELLGARSRDWNPADARWRHFIRPAEMPWVGDHVVNGSTLYPATGMIVMAVEAAKQLINNGTNVIDGYTLRDVDIVSPINLTLGDTRSVEVQTCLRQVDSNPMAQVFEFTIRTYNTSNNEWKVNCNGVISAEFKAIPGAADEWELARRTGQRQRISERFSSMVRSCRKPVDCQKMYAYLRQCGYEYGPLFQGAQQQHYNEHERQATAQVALFSNSVEDHVIHPASLDAILHLAFTGLTSGGSRPMATSIPSRIGCLWISDKGLSWPDCRAVTACSDITNITNRGFSCNGAALDSDTLTELRLWYEGVELTNVTHTPAAFSLPNPKQFCMSVERKVALNMLEPSQICSLLEAMHPADQDLSGFYRDIGLLIEVTLERLSKCIDPSTFSAEDPWRRQYWRWAEHHLALSRRKRRGDDDPHPDMQRTSLYDMDIQKLADRLENANEIGRLYVQAAAHLEGLIKGDENPLELFMQTGMLKNYYAELSKSKCTKQATAYLDLLAHQTPGLTVLEVGAGTGATTRNLIRALQSSSQGSLRCQRYDFTDVSSAFLDKAREEFAPYQSQMGFKTLDVEQDPGEQGFEEASYDIVVADNALHVTCSLAKTLRNMRKTLKTGGKLAMHEFLTPDGWTAGFVFGVFPGWWLGCDDGRPLSPHINADTWDTLLRQNGFSGADIILRDTDDEVAHHAAWIIATAVDESPRLHAALPLPEVKACKVALVANLTCLNQQILIQHLEAPLREVIGVGPRVLSLAEAVGSLEHVGQANNELVIMLTDYGAPFIASINDKNTWRQLQSLIQRTRHLLWVSSGGGRKPAPEHGMLDGLARTLRSEDYGLHLVTLALDLASGQCELNAAGLIMKVVREMASQLTAKSYEEEYIELDGLLHTKRLVEASPIKASMNAKLVPYEVAPTPVGGPVRFELSNRSMSRSRGAQDTPHYVESLADVAAEGLEHHQVEILVKAVSLQRGSRNEEEDAIRASYCAGLVLRAGIKAEFQPGDRVIAATTGTLRSHAIVSSDAVASIAEDVSFSDACRDAPILTDAHHGLVEVGHVKDSDSVLVLDGASPLGEAALRLLADRGITNIWVTASSSDECAFIESNFNLSEDRILPQSWLDNHSIVMSQWKAHFDVVFSPAADPMGPPLDVMSYLGPGGRHIIIGAQPSCRGAPTSSSTYGVPRNVSTFVIPPAETTTPRSLRHAVALLESSTLQSPKRSLAANFPASDLASAAQRLQKGGLHEVIVVRLDEPDVVEVRKPNRRRYMLDPEATYVIAGGLGGLGRAAARWLASRGARFLILISRQSKPRTDEARALLAELAEKHVHVETPPCDVSDRAALRSVLADCAKRMPRIRGCIQSSMVMNESMFPEMDFDTWKSSVDPKVAGSWNLHAELPSGLDFFILLSSIMGILGTVSLAGYNAGNTYQDALARYRVAQGERAVALDLGPVPDDGYLVEHSGFLRGLERTDKYAPTYIKEICALLDVYCDPDGPARALARDNETGCQTIIGVRPPAHWKHAEEVPATMQRPFWGHMHHVPPLSVLSRAEDSDRDAGNSAGRRSKRAAADADASGRVAAAATLGEAAEVACEALTHRVSALLGMAEDRLEPQKPMHSYGLDSLSAVEIRSWVVNVFSVDLPLFEILGGASFADAGLFIARRVQSKS
ncbi:putative polyketide synthase [Canariomyces notabilis]|uniref:Polyketide synthase n=1 Tax=Canariomyces notabilis TaxID=2074819 RepID=A0AAN6QH94_9PEZI|nr:putative polyketide synthase [Canariomyces arenarius]